MGAAAVGIVVLVAASGSLAVLAWRRHWNLPLWQTLVIGLTVRALCMALSQSVTPADVAVVFHDIGREVANGQDPVLSLPAHSWNFLPVMPMIWALLDTIAVDWVNLVKVPAVACDVANIALVGMLPPPRDAGCRRLIYALHPVAILVTALHGQVEPIALTFLLLGLVLLQRRHDVVAGTAFGLAIAVKTWPLLAVVAVLVRVPARTRGIVVGCIAIVCGAFYLSSIVLLDSAAVELAKALTSYGSFAGYWGWAGTLAAVGDDALIGYDTPASLPGTVLVAVACAAAIAVFWYCPPIRRAWTVLMASLTVTAGFGPQYLMWPVPLLTAANEPQFGYATTATLYALAAYLPLFDGELSRRTFLAGLSWLVIAAIVQLLWRCGRQAIRGQDTVTTD